MEEKFLNSYINIANLFFKKVYNLTFIDFYGADLHNTFHWEYFRGISGVIEQDMFNCHILIQPFCQISTKTVKADVVIKT